jgi:hypothetical protein
MAHNHSQEERRDTAMRGSVVRSNVANIGDVKETKYDPSNIPICQEKISKPDEP